MCICVVFRGRVFISVDINRANAYILFETSSFDAINYFLKYSHIRLSFLLAPILVMYKNCYNLHLNYFTELGFCFNILFIITEERGNERAVWKEVIE